MNLHKSRVINFMRARTGLNFTKLAKPGTIRGDRSAKYLGDVLEKMVEMRCEEDSEQCNLPLAAHNIRVKVQTLEALIDARYNDPEYHQGMIYQSLVNIGAACLCMSVECIPLGEPKEE